VGERAPGVRVRALAGLAWAGVVLDPTLNDGARGGEARVSAPGAAVRVQVIESDEESVLARAAAALTRS
jgi:acetate kinase